MASAIIVKGRLVDSRHVELDEPVTDASDEVEVILRSAGEGKPRKKSLEEFFDSLPPGTRSAEDVMKQIDEEHDAWGDR